MQGAGDRVKGRLSGISSSVPLRFASGMLHDIEGERMGVCGESRLVYSERRKASRAERRNSLETLRFIL